MFLNVQAEAVDWVRKAVEIRRTMRRARRFRNAPCRANRQNRGRGGIRAPYGGTRSLGLKRGSLVKHKKHGLAYVGGTTRGRISLHSLITGERLCQTAKPSDCEVFMWNCWRTRFAA